MNIKEYALKKEVLILAAFIGVTGLAYYLWLRNQKKNIPSADAIGVNTSTTTT